MVELIGVALLSATLLFSGISHNNTIEATEDISGTDTYVVKHKVAQEEVKDVIKLNPNTNNSANVTLEGEDTKVSMTPLGRFEATAYCPCEICSEQWSQPAELKKTAIGVGAYQGNTIAVDPEVIPYGTKLYVEGVGTFIATDCGGAIKGNKLDIYFVNHEDTGKFGRKQVNVYQINE